MLVFRGLKLSQKNSPSMALAWHNCMLGGEYLLLTSKLITLANNKTIIGFKKWKLCELIHDRVKKGYILETKYSCWLIQMSSTVIGTNKSQLLKMSVGYLPH